MKKLFFLFLVAVFTLSASAQKVYYLYLQSDNQMPFYVKMGDKIHSSAAAGFLILPNLTDGAYRLGLGFAKSAAPESNFSVTINQNDKGFIIKNFDDGLALFDIQDLSLVKADVQPKDNTVYETKSDKFSSILSKAASDPSLVKVPVAKKEEPAKTKPVETEAVAVKISDLKPAEKQIDSVLVQQTATVVKTVEPQPEPTVKENTVTQPETIKIEEVTAQPVPSAIAKEEAVAPPSTPYKPSQVSRYSESSTTEGFGLVFFDKKESGTDTIRILIPAPKVRLVSGTEASVTTVQPLKTTTSAAAEPSTGAATKNEVNNQQQTKGSLTSNCNKTASEKDFLKLRSRMAAKESEDSMLEEARKEFRNKCYSVEQIRYLSTLFLTSASKYQFFDAAYTFVSDKSNFVSLGSEIKDEHYSKRFKALIGE